MNGLRILYGPPGDFCRTETFSRKILQAPFPENARTLYLVPSHRKRRHVLDRFSAGGAGIPPAILTFHDLAEEIGRRTGRGGIPVTRKYPGIWKEFILTDIAHRLAGESLSVTVGFIRDTVRHITELKQAGLSPDHLAATPDADAGFGGVLLAMYREYEAFLERRNRTDSEGLLMALPDILDMMDESAEQPWTRIIVDGFLEFSDPQLQVLKRLERMCGMTLVWPGMPGAEPVFSRNETALRLAFPDAEWEALTPGAGPADGFAGLALRFAGATPATPAPAPFLTFMPCASVLDEVDTIARDIRRRLKITGNELRPGDICVTFPDLAAYAPLIRRLFRRHGVPVNVSQALPLAASPVFATIANVLAVPGAWARRELIALIRDPLVDLSAAAGVRLSPDTAEQLLRGMKVTRGRENWRRRIRFEMERADGHGRDRRDALAALLEVLDLIFQVLEPLDDSQSFPAFFDALIGILETLGVRTRLEQLAECRDPRDRGNEYALRGYAAFLAFRDEFQRMRSPDFLNGIMSLDTFRLMLPRVLRDISYQLTTMDEDRVQVLGRLENRGLTFRYLYLGGLTDKSFPAPDPPSPFWPPQFRSVLMDLPPEAAHAQAGADMYRFLLTPLEGLIVSRPTREGDEELLPCRVWMQLEHLVDPVTLHTTPTDPVTPIDDVMRRGRELASTVPETWPRDPADIHLLLSASAQWAYLRGDPLRHGDIPAGPLTAGIAERFGDQSVFSVSRLERLIQCPRRFFYENILGLESPEEAGEELDNMELGTLIHETLHRFYAERIAAGRGKITPEEVGQSTERISAIATELFRARDLPGVFARRDLDGITGGGTGGGIARAFAENEAALPDIMDPERLEWSFGMAAEETGLEIPLPGGGSVRIRGKIDRVDAAGEERIVIDYKSGKGPKSADFIAMKQIQVGIYMLALRALENRKVAAGCYLTVSPRHGVKMNTVIRNADSPVALKSGNDRSPSEMEEYFRDLQRIIGDAVENLRRGRFPARPGEGFCEYCGFGLMCRETAGDDDDE